MQLHRSCTLFFVTYFDRQTSTHRLDQNFILLLILILLLELRVERRGVSRVVGEGFSQMRVNGLLRFQKMRSS